MINFIKEKTINLLIEILKNGSIPDHVAFICDGNRRYARENKISKKESYLKGKNSFMHIKKIFKQIGVKEVSFFVFSIENFKRSDEEKGILFNLFREELIENECKRNTTKDYRAFVVGAIELFPEDISLKLAEGIMESFEKDDKSTKRLTAYFNACYSGMFDISQTIDCLTYCVKNDVLTVDEITVDHLEKTLWTNGSKPVDLLVRTSGEIRFSDYLLWQCNYSDLCFVDKNWPEIDEFEVLKFILRYQMNKIRNKTFINKMKNHQSKISPNIDQFLIEKEKSRILSILERPICRFNEKFIQ